jgi:hypothetical protein
MLVSVTAACLLVSCSDGGSDAKTKVKGGGSPTTVSLPGSDVGSSSGSQRDSGKTDKGSQPAEDGSASSTQGGSG